MTGLRPTYEQRLHATRPDPCLFATLFTTLTKRNDGDMPLSIPTLQTGRLKLRPIADDDMDNLFDLHANELVMRYWDSPVWTERDRAERFIANSRAMAAEGSGARFAVDRFCDATFIGWCGLHHLNRDYRSASLGYSLDATAWGHGYATEAVSALLDWGFDLLELNRVQAEVDTRNNASARVLEKLGFMQEGTLREDCIVDGEVSDSWVYGLLRRDWHIASEAEVAQIH